MSGIINIKADYRERISGIPELLIERNACVSLSALSVGDYIINEQIIVERKSAEDFVQSIINNRLFEQLSRLRKKSSHLLFLIEGDPYSTKHNISGQAIRGTLLSVSISWQIPVMFSKNTEDSADLMMVCGLQLMKENPYIPLRKSYKSKKIKLRQLRFLQGLPAVGPKLAYRLYDHFGNIRSIMNASVHELMEIDGVGRKVAQRINEFVNNPFKKEID